MRTLVILLLVPLAVAGPAASAKDRQLAGKCSESGDVCNQISVEGGVLFLSMNLAAKYFSSYQLCVKGPKSRVCKTFRMRAPDKSQDQWSSKVRWRGNFPYQGAGVYRVTWAGGDTLTF